MATSTAQRTGIWIIAVVLTVGTLAGFIAMILAPQNEATLAERQQEEYTKMMKEMQEEQAKLNKPLEGYEADKFNADDVNKLTVEVLKKGSGETLNEDSTIKANYFGWTSDGKIFDSTNKEGSEVTPIEFSLSGVIEGWTKGLSGQKVGSVVKLTIPAEQAYGSTDDGTGRPVGPLMFVVDVKELVKSDDK